MENDALLTRLQLAQRPDLEALLQDLKVNESEFASKSDAELVDHISKELRSAAGNSIATALLRRGPHDFPYRSILIDVADKLTPGLLKRSPFTTVDDHSETEIENYIADRINERVSKNLANLSETDKAQIQAQLLKELRAKGVPEAAIEAAMSGLATGTLTGVALGQVVAVLLYGGIWTTLFGFSLLQLLVSGLALGGPVGVSIATVVMLSSTSYSKTIPVVNRLIQIRKAAEVRAQLGTI